MKKYRLFLISSVVCALAVSAAPTWAHNGERDRDGEHENDQGDDNDDQGNGRHRDCDRDHNHGGFNGTINFDQGLTLTPTTNAPAGAKGKAEFILVNDNGTNYEMLFVKTVNLTNSDYTVEVTDDTGTNTYNLGTLNVVTQTNLDAGCRFTKRCGPWGGGTNAPSAGFTKWVRELARKQARWSKLMQLKSNTNLTTFATNAYCWHTNTLSVGSGSFLLPDGLSQSNATVVTVSDSNNVVMLTGDFTTTTNSTIKYKEIANLTPGTATNAQGSATITYRLAGGKAVGTFKLQATGLPSSQKLYLTADGNLTRKVYTTSQGALTVRSFPRLDLANVQSIVATDRSSNVVFSVNF